MHLRITKNIDALSQDLGNWMISHINRVLQVKEYYSLVLSGGNTPRKLYQLLASEAYSRLIDWQRIRFFWGDERCVPFNDETNNARMAFVELLSKVPVRKEMIHIIDTTQEPKLAAANYEQLLQKYIGDEESSFDLVLLGLGDNAHTLSLFPGYDLVFEKEHWVSSFYLQEQKMYRVTMTAPVVNRAAVIAFMVSGADKAKAVQQVIEEPFNPKLYPAQMIQPVKGELFWWLDEAAASKLG